MLVVRVAAGAVAGLGVVLILRGAIGSTVPLDQVVADLHRPRVVTPRLDRRAAVAGRLSGRDTPSRRADLAATACSPERYVQNRLAWAGLFAAPAAALLLFTMTGTSVAVGPGVLVVGGIVAAGVGWLYARVDLHSDAERARREFRHSLAAYLELVTILMAGGAGVETAMFDAVDAGQGRALRHVRSALSAAQARREPPWAQLDELGHRLGVPELEELHASMSLAGDGARVRDSLVAKARGIRLRDLAQIESEAQARSETMVLPVVLMFAGFLLLIGYPALAGLSSP